MRLLFICAHNSGRSQMAEAFTRVFSGGNVEAVSAGTIAWSELNPMVVEAMRERGIDITSQYPRLINQEMVDTADYTYTMGCAIDEVCPAVFVPSEDWGLDDPAGQPLEKVREIRDLVEAKVRATLQDLGFGPVGRGQT
jgi:arsenate reductase